MNLKYHGTSSKVNNDPYAFSPEKKLVLGEQTNFFNKSTACHYQNLLKIENKKQKAKTCTSTQGEIIL